MSSPHVPESRLTVTLAFLVFAIITAIVVLPGFFRSEAVSGGKNKGLFPRTSSQDPDLPNYDIRTDKKASDKIAAIRGRARKDASAVADARDRFVRAENALRARVPNLKVEYNRTLRAPEVIGPDPKMGKAALAQASNGRRPDVLKGFLKQNKDLIGATDEQVNGLNVVADYTNPDGGLSFVSLEQEVNGIPVFQGEVKAGFSKDGELVRVISNFAPGLETAALARDFGNPSDAVRAVASNIKHELNEAELSSFTQDEKSRKFKYGSSPWATSAEKIYFPTEPGVAVPAWGVTVTRPVNAFYVVVDAETDTVLWRKNLTNDQTNTTPTYYVYANPLSMLDVADSPAPMSPGAVSPLLGTQGAITSRVSRQLHGNEGVYSFNNSGWISGFNNVTHGNNVHSGLDLDGTDGIDIGSEADGDASRVFNSSWNPPPGNPAPGGAPNTAASRQGAVIQQFYIMNRYHDEMYRLGFTEAARNFQNDNFQRGGLGNDAVSAQGQDSSGTDNANFTTYEDGTPGKMQMYIWTIGPQPAPNPDPDPNRDSMADADIMIHEATHGTSNRLHGNAFGLNSDMAGGMGEGWSDFYALAMLSQASDPIDGVYPAAAYSTYDPGFVNGTANYYYGIRRFPTAIMSAKGGSNNRPHNPLSFADIDSTKMNLNDGAFSPRFTGTADQVHNAGEIWSIALWEVRALFIQRLGWDVGNRRILRLVTDGMKLSPPDPTFLSGRDAIISAAIANGTAADVADIWKGFAIRGMGFSASIENVGTGGGTARVTEAFDRPNLLQTPTFTISDAKGDGDSVYEPGETVTLTIPLTNKTGSAAEGVKLRVYGTRAVYYGTIAHTGTVSRQIDFKIPLDTPCGSALKVTLYIQSSLGHTTIDKTVYLGTPHTTYTENFDSVTAPAFPADWSVATTYSPMTFVTTTTLPYSAPNSAFAKDLPSCSPPGTTSCPDTDGGDTKLTSPAIPITISGARLMFMHKYNTETDWDGGVLEISLDGGASYQDIIVAGGVFEINGYNSSLGVSPPNPLGGRNAWSGNSGGWISSTLRLPPAAAGKNIRLRWRFGTDNNTAPTGGGWNIDSINVAGSATGSCSYTP